MKNEIKDKTIKTKNSEISNDLTPWRPTYKQFGLAMGAVLVFLIIVFIVGNIILSPYRIKEVDKRITPWLDNSKPKTSILGI
ncbi:MAG: hypothetical protein LBQ37_00160 [Elusimicrobiota bacterium]|jgi:hypothetical protein|nr:hypothetical protein [Elusimicrobiota bacterium]